MSAPPDNIFRLLHSMQSCISDANGWSTASMFKLDEDKTELMFVTPIGTKHLHNLPTSVTIGNVLITFKQSLKNFGFALDWHFAMIAHVTNIARTCYLILRCLASICRFLPHLYPLLFCQELTTVTHCCLALLLM